MQVVASIYARSLSICYAIPQECPLGGDTTIQYTLAIQCCILAIDSGRDRPVDVSVQLHTVTNPIL